MKIETIKEKLEMHKNKVDALYDENQELVKSFDKLDAKDKGRVRMQMIRNADLSLIHSDHVRHFEAMLKNRDDSS